MKKYKVNWSTQFSNGGSLFLWILLMVCLVVYSSRHFNRNDLSYVYEFTFILFLIQFIPHLIQHLNYYFLNKDDELIFSSSTNDFCFKNSKNEVKFNLREIEKLEVYKSYAMHHRSIPIATWNNYNHIVIYLNTGTKLTITSLLTGLEFKLPVRENIISYKLPAIRLAKGPSILIQ